MESSKKKFLPLESREVLTKLKILSEQKASFDLWRKEETPLSLTLFESLGEINTLVFGLPDKFDYKEGDSLFIRFKFNNLDYFSKGEISKFQSNHTFHLKIGVKYYRVENRESERLLTYPHRKYFVFFEKENHNLNNVISLRSDTRLQLDAFKEFKTDFIKQVFGKHFDKYKIDPNTIVGFRIIDLSREGVSFLVNEAEKQLVDDVEERVCYLLAGENSFQLKCEKQVYCLDYVSSQLGQLSMFKVGMKFNPSEEYKVYWRNILSQIDGSLKDDIENFSF